MTEARPPRDPKSPNQDKEGSGGEQPGPFRGWMFFVLLLLGGMFVYSMFAAQDRHFPEMPYSRFYELLEKGQVRKVAIKGLILQGELKEPAEIKKGREASKQFSTQLPEIEDKELLPKLRAENVEVQVKENVPVWAILINFGPILLIGALLFWSFRRAQRVMGSGNPFGMLKGRTKRFDKESQVPVDFAQVAGHSAAKQDLQEIVQFLKKPEEFRRLGGKVPRGVLLVGPPGTGKTLLARAVAGEAGVPFFSINGSEFIELFVGVGASRVRELFDEAKKVAPAIIFIDEIDAVGRSRGAGLGGGHDEREQTLNQLLSEMDGFSRNDLTIVIAATNRPDVLDPALLRPGRFDRRVVVDRPERGARKAILQVHTKEKPLAEDVQLDDVAANTPGFSGADLANLVNEAALAATRRGASAIERLDFTAAFDKIVLGEKRETKLDPEEKRRVAIHEAGHAVVAHYSERSEPLRRVTIIPRGMALGVTQQTPAQERHILTQPEIEARLRMMMGGYAAEREALGEISSGAANDLQKATELAFKMVGHFGMSEKVGPVFFEHKTEHPFLGQSLASEGGTSDATVHLIEQETRRILSDAVSGASRLIQQHRDAFDRLVQALLERETVEEEAIEQILGPPASLHASVPPPSMPPPPQPEPV